MNVKSRFQNIRESIRSREQNDWWIKGRKIVVTGVPNILQAAYLNVLEAQQRIVAAQAAVDEGKEVFRIEALKVREGKSIIENLLDAQTAQLQAEQNYSAAVADYQVQLMALKKAIGQIEV